METATLLREFRLHKKLMGCDFELIAVDEDPDKAQTALQKGVSEIERIEGLLSEFRHSSQTSVINQRAGKESLSVDPETWQLIKRCLEISRITQGAFDITVGALKKLYRFDNSLATFPEEKDLNDTLAKTGYTNISLMDDHRIFFNREGMHISFAAIGKGYAADCVLQLWKQMKVMGGAVNASGDLAVFGEHPDGKNWKIGIAHPDRRSEIVLSVPLNEGAVATSGDYEQYFIQDGIRYSHNIHPVTGKPLKGLKSVTVVTTNAALADALSTAVYVMGVNVGLHFINQLPNTHCVIIDERNQFHYSENMKVKNA